MDLYYVLSPAMADLSDKGRLFMYKYGFIITV